MTDPIASWRKRTREHSFQVKYTVSSNGKPKAKKEEIKNEGIMKTGKEEKDKEQQEEEK